MKSGIAAFIEDQLEAIVRLRKSPIDDRCSLEAEYYLVRGKGVVGYLKEIPALRKKIRDYKPDIIHAHYGLCGLLANLTTRRVPVVTTYHGSDINDDFARKYSKIAIRLSAWNIFVSPKNIEKVGQQHAPKTSLIPCGIDETLFVPKDKENSRIQLEEREKWKEGRGKKYVLFSKMFTDEVKDYPLAKATVDMLNDVELLEFKGYSREESVLLMNAVDAVLLTSKTEGSPQVIKEAMACGCPIVSVDVGDVKERIEGVEGCYLVESRDPKELAEALRKAIAYGRTDGREALMKQNLSNTQIAERIVKIYEQVIDK